MSIQPIETNGKCTAKELRELRILPSSVFLRTKNVPASSQHVALRTKNVLLVRKFPVLQELLDENADHRKQSFFLWCA